MAMEMAQGKTLSRFKPERVVLLTIAVIAALAVASASIVLSRSRGDASLEAAPPPGDPDDRSRRALSLAFNGGGCEVTPAFPSEKPVAPVWQASYPGSGARMTLFLVEALTGTQTNTDYDPHRRGYERVVTVKTHYPLSNHRRFPGLDEAWPFERAVVLIRHPKDAIPSLFNLHYEQSKHLPGHSTRAPQGKWLKYRDNQKRKNCNVFCEINKYEQFLDYWMTKYVDRNMLHVFSYEDMTNTETGPGAAATLASFLGRADGVRPIAEESVPCVWEMVVNYKNHMDVLRRDPHSEREGPRIRPYTEEMLQEMIAMLERLKGKYGDDEELGRILDMYIEITLNTEAEEGLI